MLPQFSCIRSGGRSRNFFEVFCQLRFQGRSAYDQCWICTQNSLTSLGFAVFGDCGKCIFFFWSINNSSRCCSFHGVRNLRFQSSYCAKVGAKAKNKTKQNRTKKNHSSFLLSPTFSTNSRWNACHVISHKSKVHLNHIIRCCRKPVICGQVLISSLTNHNFQLYYFEKGFDLILFS